MGPMKKSVKKKIWLVVDIVAVLVVLVLTLRMFLPQIWKVPSLGRDTERIENAILLEDAIIEHITLGGDEPTTEGPITNDLLYSETESWAQVFEDDFNNYIPRDDFPDLEWAFDGPEQGFFYLAKDMNEFDVLIFARVENFSNSNAACSSIQEGALVLPTNDDSPETGKGNWCFVTKLVNYYDKPELLEELVE